jgi:hypothetical protein
MVSTKIVVSSLCSTPADQSVILLDRSSQIICALAPFGNDKCVFVRNGKVYDIENQDYAGLQQYAGESVRVTGELSGDSIKISNIDSAGGKS